MLRPPRMRVRVRVQPMHLSINRMIPNILTLLALCAGMTGIRLAIVGKFETAVAAIIVAGILDGLDGRIARLLKGTSTFVSHVFTHTNTGEQDSDTATATGTLLGMPLPALQSSFVGTAKTKDTVISRN